MLPREEGNSRDRDLGGSRGGSIPGVSKDARVRTTRARTARKRARAGLWRRRRVPRLGEWRSPDHFVSNALNPRALVIFVSFAVTAMRQPTCVSHERHREILLSTSRKSSPNPERVGSQLDARGAGPGPRSRIRAVRFGRAVRRDGRRRRRRERRWGQRHARPPHASFVHLPPDVRHLRVARGAVGRGRGPRDAREARAPARGRRERDPPGS